MYCLVCHNRTNKSSICGGCLGLLGKTKNVCKKCSLSLGSESTSICGECQKSEPYFSKIIFACDYKYPVDEWIKSLKFANKRSLSKLMAEVLYGQYRENIEKYTIAPIPLHRKRLRQRGYNQAFEIAFEIAKLSGKNVETLLERKKETEMQATLKYEQRRKNIKNAFIENDQLLIKGKKIILVDDVMTSGYTMNECSKILKKNGATQVVGMVFARKQR